MGIRREGTYLPGKSSSSVIQTAMLHILPAPLQHPSSHTRRAASRVMPWSDLCSVRRRAPALRAAGYLPLRALYAVASVVLLLLGRAF